MHVTWIRLYSDYPIYRLGLSPKRAQWMADWVGGLAEEGVVTGKQFAQGLGHLGFTKTTLVWERGLFWGRSICGSKRFRAKKKICIYL